MFYIKMEFGNVDGSRRIIKQENGSQNGGWCFNENVCCLEIIFLEIFVSLFVVELFHRYRYIENFKKQHNDA